jgi:hypothetical protein
MAKDIKRVRIQQMPSLSGADRWHADHNSCKQCKSCLMLHYNYRDGKIGELKQEYKKKWRQVENY